MVSIIRASSKHGSRPPAHPYGTTARTASSLCPDLFDAPLVADVTAWLARRTEVERKDPYLGSAIASGVAP